MDLTQRLSDRTAVVTGGGQGIGSAVAQRLADEGARVAVVDLDLANATHVSDKITAIGGQALAVECDVADRESVERAAALTVEQLGRIDILISNAGITRPAMLWKMTEQEWDQVLDVHLKGSFFWLQEVQGPMREARSGNIVLTVSAAGIIGSIGQVNYSVAKAGLLGMTRSAAKELASYGIVVNAVAPAAATPMTTTIRTDERFKDKFLGEVPLARWAEPAEVAGTFAFLASSDAQYMTGQVLAVDGGRVMVR